MLPALQRTTLFVLLFLGTNDTYAQTLFVDDIIGAWIYDNTCDSVPTTKKTEFAPIPWCPPDTDNGTGRPTRTFYRDGTFMDYYTTEHVEYGHWSIKNAQLILEHKIPKPKDESGRKRLEQHVAKGLIFRKGGEFYHLHKSVFDHEIMLKQEYQCGWKKIHSIVPDLGTD